MIPFHVYLGSAIFGCCLLASCGRKQHSIFDFDPEKKVKINKLSLPAVKNIHYQESTDQSTIAWLPILHKNLIGYNVYSVARGLIVSKKPRNKKPLQTTSIPLIQTEPSCFIVRGVFKLHAQIIEGPASQVCWSR